MFPATSLSILFSHCETSYRNGALCNTRKTLKNIGLLPVSSFSSSNPIECLVTKLRTFDKHSSKKTMEKQCWMKNYLSTNSRKNQSYVKDGGNYVHCTKALKLWVRLNVRWTRLLKAWLRMPFKKTFFPKFELVFGSFLCKWVVNIGVTKTWISI